MTIEPRVLKLEEIMGDIRASLARTEEKLAATATAAQAEYLRGLMEGLSTTWQMIAGLVPARFWRRAILGR